jgi:hypothetical protein
MLIARSAVLRHSRWGLRWRWTLGLAVFAQTGVLIVHSNELKRAMQQVPLPFGESQKLSTDLHEYTSFTLLAVLVAAFGVALTRPQPVIVEMSSASQHAVPPPISLKARAASRG